MMNRLDYDVIATALAGGFRAAIYCRLSKDDDLDGLKLIEDFFPRNGVRDIYA